MWPHDMHQLNNQMLKCPEGLNWNFTPLQNVKVEISSGLEKANGPSYLFFVSSLSLSLVSVSSIKFSSSDKAWITSSVKPPTRTSENRMARSREFESSDLTRLAAWTSLAEIILTMPPNSWTNSSRSFSPSRGVTSRSKLMMEISGLVKQRRSWQSLS